MDEQRKQSDDAGTQRIFTLRVCENVAEVRSDDTHDGKQEIERTHDEHRYHSVTPHLPLHAHAEWRERSRTETRTLGARNRVIVDFETKAETT